MNHRRRPPEPPIPDPNGYPRTRAAVTRHDRHIGLAGWVAVAAAVGIVATGIYVVWREGDSATAAAKAASRTPVAKPTATPGPPVQRKPTEYAPTPASQMGDGTWIVGKEIRRGMYAAPGGALCYWERVSDLTGSPDSLIDNAFGRRGPQKVALGPADFAFTTSGCGPWVEVTR